jgi:hypothetical protein
VDHFIHELDQFFCANPSCELHLHPGSPKVRGRGNWAQRSDGILVGRSRYADRIYCDLCGQTLIDTRNTNHGRAFA